MSSFFVKKTSSSFLRTCPIFSPSSPLLLLLRLAETLKQCSGNGGNGRTNPLLLGKDRSPVSAVNGPQQRYAHDTIPCLTGNATLLDPPAVAFFRLSILLVLCFRTFLCALPPQRPLTLGPIGVGNPYLKSRLLLPAGLCWRAPAAHYQTYKYSRLHQMHA